MDRQLALPPLGISGARRPAASARRGAARGRPGRSLPGGLGRERPPLGRHLGFGQPAHALRRTRHAARGGGRHPAALRTDVVRSRRGHRGHRDAHPVRLRLGAPVGRFRPPQPAGAGLRERFVDREDRRGKGALPGFPFRPRGGQEQDVSAPRRRAGGGGGRPRPGGGRPCVAAGGGEDRRRVRGRLPPPLGRRAGGKRCGGDDHAPGRPLRHTRAADIPRPRLVAAGRAVLRRVRGGGGAPIRPARGRARPLPLCRPGDRRVGRREPRGRRPARKPRGGSLSSASGPDRKRHGGVAPRSAPAQAGHPHRALHGRYGRPVLPADPDPDGSTSRRNHPARRRPDVGR